MDENEELSSKYLKLLFSVSTGVEGFKFNECFDRSSEMIIKKKNFFCYLIFNI